MQKDCESIAFPLISSGVYRYPKAEALQIATSAIRDFLTEHDLHVFLVVYDKDAFLISEHLFGEVEDYLWEHLVEERYDRFITGSVFESRAMSVSAEPLEDLIGNLDQSFGETLLSLIDAKGKTDVEVYKRANLDRRLFSKIRSIKGYLPASALHWPWPSLWSCLCRKPTICWHVRGGLRFPAVKIRRDH